MTPKQWRQVVIHAGIVGAAAVLTYGAEYLQAQPTAAGVWTPVAVAGISLLLKLMQKIAEDDHPATMIHAQSVSDARQWHSAARDD